MLFGVRVTEANSFRKSASMNNLSQYEQTPPQDPNAADAGYASDDVVHASGRSRERKRGKEISTCFIVGLNYFIIIIITFCLVWFGIRSEN